MARSNHITLNGKEFSLFKDYSLKQRGDLRALPTDDKLKYLEERARLVFLDALDEWLSFLNSESLSSFHELNMVTLACCAIEGLVDRVMSQNPPQTEKASKIVSLRP